MKYAGIDLSYTSPAIAIYDTNSQSFVYENISLHNLYEEKRKTKSHDGIYSNLRIDQIGLYGSQVERFAMISDWAMECLNDVKNVFIEGYSYGSTGAVFDIAENCGILKYRMWQDGKEVMEISPGQHKKSFSGKGSSNKQQMVDCFIDKFGVELHSIIGLSDRYSKPVDDLVDAVSILHKGLKDKGLI